MEPPYNGVDFAGCGFDEIDGHVFYCAHVFRAVFGSQPHKVVVKDDLKHPVKAVFDIPVGAALNREQEY